MRWDAARGFILASNHPITVSKPHMPLVYDGQGSISESLKCGHESI